MSLENVDLPIREVATDAAAAAVKDAGTDAANDTLMDTEMTMSVSPVCVKDGKQYAFVSFAVAGQERAQGKTAEGRIPECKIIANNGFTEGEVEQLERYMKRELTNLKKMASSVNVLGAFMKS